MRQAFRRVLHTPISSRSSDCTLRVRFATRILHCPPYFYLARCISLLLQIYFHKIYKIYYRRIAFSSKSKPIANHVMSPKSTEGAIRLHHLEYDDNATIYPSQYGSRTIKRCLWVVLGLFGLFVLGYLLYCVFIIVALSGWRF